LHPLRLGQGDPIWVGGSTIEGFGEEEGFRFEVEVGFGVGVGVGISDGHSAS